MIGAIGVVTAIKVVGAFSAIEVVRAIRVIKVAGVVIGADARTRTIAGRARETGVPALGHHSASEPSRWRQMGLRQRWPISARSRT